MGFHICFQVITIQTHTRRWLAKRLTTQLRLDKELHLAWIEREERRKKEEKEEQIRAEYSRRMSPKKKEDFALLYNALESKKECVCVRKRHNRTLEIYSAPKQNILLWVLCLTNLSNYTVKNITSCVKVCFKHTKFGH